MNEGDWFFVKNRAEFLDRQSVKILQNQNISEHHENPY
jgi:hypothetical protein